MTEKIDHSSRDHALLSASSSARWLACPPSAVAAEAYPRQTTDYTQEGTLAHEVAEQVARLWVQPSGDYTLQPPEGATAEMVECAHGYADYIQEQITSQNALVLLEQRVDFSPWVPGGFGTADCIIIQDGTLDVIDYKFGKGVAVSAVKNSQMLLYGLGALNDYGFACDIKQVRLHIYQPRMNNTSQDTLPASELLQWGEDVKPVAQKAEKGKGTYTPGEHCRFCPHAGRCRALTKTCTEYVTAHGMRAPVQVLAPWEVAEVLQLDPLVALWLRRVKDQALTALLNGQDIPGYKLVEGKQGNRKWTNDAQVCELLSNAGYTSDQYTEVKVLSPAAMDKALGKKTAAELLADLTERAPGAPTVVPQTDKRPAYDRLAEAKKDFE